MANNSANEDDYSKKVYNIDNWQKMHVQQLGYTRNLFILLASAALGYTLSILNPSVNYSIGILLKAVSVLYLSSLTIGVYIAYFESENYRLKYYISRIIQKGHPLEEHEKKCTRIEARNRVLIVIQIVLLMIGVITETILLIVMK